MAERQLNIAFMGTPEFAVPSLEAILDENFKVSVVVSAPDRQAGRGLKLRSSAVKLSAEKFGIPVLQPIDLKDPAFIESLKSYGINLILVIAFRKLPAEVFDLPEFGCINLHASLLPKYRGAAPIQRAIMNGETQTGLSTFFINDKIDRGKIILQSAVEIKPEETSEELHDKLKYEGAKLVVETLKLIRDNKVVEKAQEELVESPQSLKTAPKIFREDCKIDWSKSAQEIHNQVRALSPYPSAYSFLQTADQEQQEVKIIKSQVIAENSSEIPGQITTDHKTFIHVQCGEGQVDVLRLQSAGRKALDTAEWLRGQKIDNNWIFR